MVGQFLEKQIEDYLFCLQNSKMSHWHNPNNFQVLFLRIAGVGYLWGRQGLVMSFVFLKLSSSSFVLVR